MKNIKTRTLAASLLIALMATATYAAPHPVPDPKARAEKLATAPGLTQAQRDDIVRIEDETRAAQQALMEKTRSEREKLRDEATRKMRAALGDKAYADYVTWRMEQRGEHRAERRDHPHDRLGHPLPPAADGEIQPPAVE